jgi:4a-hydroxytetrahydrobiopterin dehydratase
MPRPPRLDTAEIGRRLERLPGWEIRDGKLHRDFTFSDFAEAFRFMTEVATEAEQLQHHPDWCNVYNRVSVDLSTHDVGGITALDFELAWRAQRVAGAAR